MSISILKNSFTNSSYKKHFHSTYSISLIIKGVCVININNNQYSFSKGQIRVISPYDMHEILKSSWEHINLTVSAYFVNSICKNYKIFKNFIEDQNLANMIQKAYNEKTNLQIQTEEIIRYLDKNYSIKKGNNDIFYIEKEVIKKAIEYIVLNANNTNISLDEIADFTGISKYHFLRVFKKYTGFTPKHFIQNIKINNARKQLTNDGISLTQIAMECGFYDQSHFIRTYKKFYGGTPSKIK